MTPRLAAIHDLRMALALLAFAAAVFLIGYLTGHRTRQRRPASPDLTRAFQRKGTL